MNALEIKNLNVSIEGQSILKDFSLTIPKGEVHALMGPNGTGKSTLAKVMAGHEDYEVESGSITLDGENILGEEPDAIAHAGLFLAFQYPLEIPGVSIANFIRAARAARLPEGESINAVEYYKELYEKMDALKTVSEGVNLMRGPERGFLVITHYQRLLDYIVPDVVHVMFDGRIVHSGSAELARELEAKGYDWVKEAFATTA